MRWTPWQLAALFALFGAVVAVCLWGVPPPVDLAGHGGQLMAMADWLRGDERLRALYDLRFHVGYGLPLWLFLPAALLFDGAVAAKLAMAVSLLLFPAGALCLARALGRSDRAALLALPFAFNISYWYGLLPGLFAQPLVLFGLAAFVVALRTRRWAWLAATAALLLACALSHLLTGGALGLGLAALAVAPAVERRLTGGARGGPVAWGALTAVAAPSALVGAAEVLRLLSRSVAPEEGHPATEWSLDGHTAWFFRVYGPEGVLAVLLPVALVVVFVAVWWSRRKDEPVAPALVFAALALAFVVMPKIAGGIYLACTRLPVLAGLAALFLVELPARAWRALALLVVLSLGETVAFHLRFDRFLAGADDVLRAPVPAGPHGYASLLGNQALGSKHIYLEHVGQWRTARLGGVGHNFFADADHHPIHFKPGQRLPMSLGRAPTEDWLGFDELLLLTDGSVPAELAGWRELRRAGRFVLVAKP